MCDWEVGLGLRELEEYREGIGESLKVLGSRMGQGAWGYLSLHLLFLDMLTVYLSS